MYVFMCIFMYLCTFICIFMHIHAYAMKADRKTILFLDINYAADTFLLYINLLFTTYDQRLWLHTEILKYLSGGSFTLDPWVDSAAGQPTNRRSDLVLRNTLMRWRLQVYSWLNKL